MAESRQPNILERNKPLCEELDAMHPGDTLVWSERYPDIQIVLGLWQRYHSEGRKFEAVRESDRYLITRKK